MIEFKAECGHTIRVKDEDAGKVVRCSYCGRETQAPDSRDGAGSDELEYLFSEVERTGVYETPSDRQRVKRMRRKGGTPKPSGKPRPTVSNPFGLVLKLCYVCLIIAIVIFVGKKLYRTFNPDEKGRRQVARRTAESEERGGGGASSHGGGLGLLRPRLPGGGCGIYVNSVPGGADVYITDKGRIGRGDSIFRVPSDQLVASLQSGNLAERLKAGHDYDIYVTLRINDPTLMRLPGYPALRRKFEETGDERLFEGYFLPDGAVSVQTDRQPNRPEVIVRKYECKVFDRTWSPVVALFLPELPLPDLIHHLPREKVFGFREQDVQQELEYYGIPAADRKFMIDILSRIGIVPWQDDEDGYYRIFAINLSDGSIYCRPGRFGTPDRGSSSSGPGIEPAPPRRATVERLSAGLAGVGYDP